MRTARLGGGEANPDVSNFNLAAAQLRRNCQEPRSPLLAFVMLRQVRCATGGVRF